MPEEKQGYVVTAGKPAAQIDDYEFFNLPSDLVDDWRWSRVQHLGLFWLDRQLVEKQAEFIKAQGELDDAIAHVRECKQRLESQESRIRKDIDEKEIFGDKRGSQGEREKKRDVIVVANDDYQTRLKAYNAAVAIRDRCQIERDLAEDDLKNVRMRINWRMHLLTFMGTLRPIPLDRVPEDDGTIPALKNKPKPEPAAEPMNVQTRDWLAAMQNKQVRYGLPGKMVHQTGVLPEGVDPEHSRVKEMMADLEAHFSSGPKL